MRLLSVDARVGGRDRSALARIIESAQADVACVHGAPHLLRWRSISAALGRRAGLVVVGGGRPAGATLLLSTLAVDELLTRDLQFAGDTPVRPAGAVLALLRVAGHEVVVAGAAFTGDGPRPAAQARQLREAVARFVPGDAPVVLSVAGADAPTLAALADDRTLVQQRIVVDRGVSVGATEQPTGSAAALVVELTL